MNALLMAVWRRRPADPVMVHSDQGSQFTSKDWRDFLVAHRLEPSMSRRGNCHDNAVAESFFQLLKRERIKRKTYASRDDARQDIFDYIEMFYNPKRRHGFNDRLSPAEFERRRFERLASVWQTRGDSTKPDSAVATAPEPRGTACAGRQGFRSGHR